MTYYLALTAAVIISYIIGSLNTALITVYLLKRKDVREYGSKNAGLTNVYRCFGSVCAGVTLICDIAKSFVVVFGTKFVLFGTGWFLPSEHDEMSALLLVTLFAVIGHIFPVFYKFKGGKGILLAAMSMLCSDPMVFIFEAATFFIGVAVSKYISVGSIAACIGYPIFTFIFDMILLDDKTYMPLHILISFAIGALCLVRHSSNIKRLKDHTENKFTLKRKGE